MSIRVEIPAGGWLKPTAPPDHEQAAIAVARDAYVAGRISLADYEDRVERILADPHEDRRVAVPLGPFALQRPDPMTPQTH